MVTPKRRAGKTETFSVSVDRTTKRKLKAAAERLHGGNMSALFVSVAAKLEDDEAFEAAWRWYAGPDLTDRQREAIDAELEGRPVPRPKRKTRAA